MRSAILRTVTSTLKLRLPGPAKAVRPLVRNALVLLLAMATGGLAAQGFKFSQPDDSAKAAKAEEDAKRERVSRMVSVPCRAELKDQKIMIVIGERQSNGWIVAEQSNYGPHFQAIDQRLRALGLRTYTPEEIKRQVAQAEIDAYFRNDPDAALAASKRLGAKFVLRGLISADAAGNRIMAVNQVSVTMGFTLSASDGRVISNAEASEASYAGNDIARMALTLVDEKADEVVARLYSDYCRKATIPPARKPAPK